MLDEDLSEPDVKIAFLAGSDTKVFFTVSHFVLHTKSMHGFS